MQGGGRGPSFRAWSSWVLTVRQPSRMQVFQTSAEGGRAAGECVATFQHLDAQQRAGLTALLFSADGSTLFSGAGDGSIVAWRLSWRPAAARKGMRKGFF